MVLTSKDRLGADEGRYSGADPGRLYSSGKFVKIIFLSLKIQKKYCILTIVTA